MTEPEGGEEATLFPKTAGERLREARVGQGLSLADIATRTRVPMRHLEAIENSNYSGLPSPTYAVGFAKAYARAVGADEVEIGREVRNLSDAGPRMPEYQPYELDDPARLPPRGLATVVGVVAALLTIGVIIWYGTNWFRSEEAPPAPVATADTPVAAPAAAPVVPVSPPPTASGQVTLVARDVVWMRVYDAAGKTLFQGELQPGNRYDVPAGADRPMINVGRPDQLQVLVNGSQVQPLGDGKRAIKDVEITAAALMARGKTDAANGAGTASSTTSPASPAPPAARTPSPVPSSSAPSATPPKSGTRRQASPPRPSAQPRATTPSLPEPALPAPIPANGAAPGATGE